MNICERCGKEHDGNFGSGRFCSRSCANKQTHNQETKEKIKNSINEFYKDHPERLIKLIIKICPICKQSFKTFSAIYCSAKCHHQDQKNGFKYSKKSSNGGGYRLGSGRGKSGWYKGIFCNSSYELAWVIYHLDNNVIFQRNQQGFNYVFENKQYKYYPDFIVDDTYIEVKGFKQIRDNYKWNQFPYKLKVVSDEEIKVILDYVRSKYGIHFEELYEGNPHNQKLNKCLVCNKPAKFKFCSRKCCGKYYGTKHMRPQPDLNRYCEIENLIS